MVSQENITTSNSSDFFYQRLFTQIARLLGVNNSFQILSFETPFSSSLQESFPAAKLSFTDAKTMLENSVSSCNHFQPSQFKFAFATDRLFHLLPEQRLHIFSCLEEVVSDHIFLCLSAEHRPEGYSAKNFATDLGILISTFEKRGWIIGWLPAPQLTQSVIVLSRSNTEIQRKLIGTIISETMEAQSVEEQNNVMLENVVEDQKKIIQQLERQLDFELRSNKILTDQETNRYTFKGLIKTAIGIVSKTIIGDIAKDRFFQKRKNTNINFASEIKKQCEQNNANLIIVFPIIDWGFRKQRPQHIISRLNKYENTVLYGSTQIPPLKRYQNSVKNKQLDSFCRFSISKIENKIFQYQLNGYTTVDIYNNVPNEENFELMLSSIKEIISYINPQKITYLVQFPSWWPFVEELKKHYNGKVIFDCMDDHSGFSNTTAIITETEDVLLEKADLVLASSLYLEDKCIKRNRNTILVRNATEFEHFHRIPKNGKLDHLTNKPIIGYYGAIAEWFDVDIVRYCASQRPDLNFVLIGASTNSNIYTLDALNNVFFVGEVDYRQLAGYLAYFDVATIPFIINDLTKATNPVKFYEYLSAGKPVVATPMPELLEYEEYCYIANDQESFLEKLDLALASKNDILATEAYYRVAQNNSWDERVQTILKHTDYLR